MTALGISLQVCALTLIAMYIGLVVRDARHVPAARYSVLALLACSLFFVQLPGVPRTILMVVHFFDILSLPLIWWAAIALIEEDFKPRALHWAGFLLAAGSVLPWRLARTGIVPPVSASYPIWVPDLIAVVLFGYLSWLIIVGFRDDLVTPRRRVRLVMLIFVVIATLTATIGENFFEIAGYSNFIIPYTAAITIPVVAVLIFWTSRLEPAVLAFQPLKHPEPSAPAIRPQDKALHAKLIDAMERDRIWAEPGLTIGALAEKIGAPEHHLRTLINRGMGHRNFSSFLNSYRLGYAKRVLGDIEQARLPILSIAMDAGFASLAPFNRAFKAAEGKTPSEYRALALSNQN